MTTVLGSAVEATYYSLLLMPPNGNISQAFAYTPAEIFAFWEEQHVSNPTLSAHSHIELTQDLVDTALTFGAARALFVIVFADGLDSRYMINHLLKQIPVQMMRFLVAIGVFDEQIAAIRNTCRIETMPYTTAPAIPSSVQPPTDPDNVILGIQIPITGVSGGCAPTSVATTAETLGAIRLGAPITNTCTVDFP